MSKKVFAVSAFFLLLISIGGYLYPPQNKIKQKVTVITQKVDQIVETVAPQPTKILESGLPDKHLIKTAFIPQAPEKIWDQPWQDACEEAAILTAHYYYQNQQPSISQIRDAVLSMINFEDHQHWSKDITLVQMATISSQYLGYKVEVVTDPSLDQLKKYVSQNIPIIVPANGKTLYQENKYFKNNGPWYHNVVILGYDDTKSKFIVHDVGTQFGAYFKYSYQLLLDSIHDFPPSLKKEDIDSGQKQVLLLIK